MRLAHPYRWPPRNNTGRVLLPKLEPLTEA
jgi:hypothetical protein